MLLALALYNAKRFLQDFIHHDNFKNNQFLLCKRENEKNFLTYESSIFKYIFIIHIEEI